MISIVWYSLNKDNLFRNTIISRINQETDSNICAHYILFGVQESK